MRAHLGQAGKADIVANAVAKIETGEFSVLRHEGEPERHSIRGTPNAYRLTFQTDCALGGFIQSEKTVEYFRTTRPHQSVDAKDLTLVRGEGDIGYLAWCAEAQDLEAWNFCRDIRLDVFVAQFPSDDQTDQVCPRDSSEIAAVDIAAVAKHGIGVGNLKNLRQSMRDVDDPFAARFQPSDCGKKLLRFLFANGRRRFVHENDFGVVTERFCDLNQLNLRDGQIHHELIGANFEFELVEKFLSIPIHRLEVDAAETTKRFSAQIDVFRHGHVRDGAQLLLDYGDARLQRFSRAGICDFFSAPPDVTFVTGVNAHQNFQKGGFARAVAPAKCMHRAGPQPEASVPQGGNAAEGLFQSLHIQQKFQCISSAGGSCSAAGFNGLAVVLTIFD